ncbi:MAG TPA: FMN-binding negative transcriptional regulator [Jatrophihabitans sp.]|nr:FMN-binding negative transcriptional regulator [Jatrophihabitans sp.]
MYVPTHFAAPEAEVDRLLAELTAVDLITAGPTGLQASFLPMLHDAQAGSLVGHLARNNPHWRAARTGESLVIVRGPDAYVSPSWYPSKAEHGRVVPTWNYLTAHVYGRLVVHDDVEWLRALVTRLTEHHEARRTDQLAGRWAVSDAPPAFIDGQLRAIVGVELVISRIEAKAKLSQNRPPADQAGVLAGLGPDSPVAELMRGRPD